MRETRLLNFQSHAQEKFVSVKIAVTPPRADRSSFTSGTWAGITGSFAAWRVEDGCNLIIENILTRRAVLIHLSSPLTCRPMLKKQPDNDSAIDVLLSCHSLSVGCTLVRLCVHLPSSPASEMSCEEVSRLPIRAAFTTCIIELGGLIVIGLSDGRCAQLNFMPPPSRKIASRMFGPSARVMSDDHAPGENTSMISAESGASRRSMASSMSFGLMSRLFGSPRAASTGQNGHPNEVSTQDQDESSTAHNRGSMESNPGGGVDAVVAIAEVSLAVKALISLHRSGRVCVFIESDAFFNYAGDLMIPAKLSTSTAHQFLLTGLSSSVLAVITADEDPRADSVCIFNVTAKIRPNKTVALSCTQIAKRNGPFDRIVGACFTGDDIVVGTESGYVSGLLNVSNESDSGSGVPSGTVWTVLDDVDKPFGLGRILDDVLSDPKKKLTAAHRFQSTSLAKALRIENATTLSQAEVWQIVRETSFGEEMDEETMWKRVKARAEQYTKSDDLRVRDLSLVSDVGIVIARHGGMYILRKLLDPERNAFGHSHLLSNRAAFANGTIATLLSSHAACQLLSTQYAAEKLEGEAKTQLQFMLTIAATFSDVESNIPITDRITMLNTSKAEQEPNETSDIESAVASVMATLEPGSLLLKFLHSSSEMNTLTFAAEHTANRLPISSMFASGISTLAHYRKISAHLYAGVDASGRGLNREHNGQNPFLEEYTEANGLLERAYAFLLTAAECCSETNEYAQEDINCAMTLSGLTDQSLSPVERQENDTDAVMTPAGSPLPQPSGPSSSFPGDVAIRENLSFWILERSVRLLEGSGASKSAAAAALEAMARAPDSERFEMMRAAAFGRFLDAGELEHALTAILNQPFTAEDSSFLSLKSSGALRDFIGLFVNAAADRGMLQWLASCALPEPLRVLCGLALERRARAADAMQVVGQSPSDGLLSNQISDLDNVRAETDIRGSEEYQHLYSWHILRGDDASAAVAALEWAERLNNEGIAVIRNVTMGKSALVASRLQLRMLLEWTKAKCTALSYASSAIQLQPESQQFIARSRFSLLGQESDRIPGVVDASWVSRRHLLAHGQSKCLTKMSSERISESGTTPNVHYLIAHGSTVLSEHKQGVSWVVSYLSKEASFDDMLLCAELCVAWMKEAGDSLLLEVVREAARVAARKSARNFGYDELDQLVRAVESKPECMRSSRNWYLIALEAALATTAGPRATPQWLLDAAAWGAKPKSTDVERSFAGRTSADAAGVVRALLRCNRPVPAAKLLLTGLETGRTGVEKENRITYVPYSAIDATIETLAQLEDDYPEAGVFRKKLMDCASAHIKEMESVEECDKGRFMGVSVL